MNVMTVEGTWKKRRAFDGHDGLRFLCRRSIISQGRSITITKNRYDGNEKTPKYAYTPFHWLGLVFKYESFMKRNPHPICRLAWLWVWLALAVGVGGLAAGGLSPALCNLSHTIFSSLCWLLFTIAMAPQSISIDYLTSEIFRSQILKSSLTPKNETECIFIVKRGV